MISKLTRVLPARSLARLGKDYSSGHGVDRDARARDVGERGRDDERDAGALELPGQVAQRR